MLSFILDLVGEGSMQKMWGYTDGSKSQHDEVGWSFVAICQWNGQLAVEGYAAGDASKLDLPEPDKTQPKSFTGEAIAAMAYLAYVDDRATKDKAGLDGVEVTPMRMAEELGGFFPVSADRAIAALRKNSTLQHLSLRSNQIKAAACDPLAEALRENTTLTELDLDLNQVTTHEAIRAFVPVLSEANDTVTVLKVGANVAHSCTRAKERTRYPTTQAFFR